MPAASSAITPASATAIENTQARMRPVSPMLTQSETAPMAQKLVLLVTAPMTSGDGEHRRQHLDMNRELHRAQFRLIHV